MYVGRYVQPSPSSLRLVPFTFALQLCVPGCVTFSIIFSSEEGSSSSESSADDSDSDSSATDSIDKDDSDSGESNPECPLPLVSSQESSNRDAAAAPEKKRR